MTSDDRKTDADLIATMASMPRNEEGSCEMAVLRAELERRAAARQAESSTYLAAATDRLVGATRGLRLATWMLVALTFVLAGAAAVPVLQARGVWPWDEDLGARISGGSA